MASKAELQDIATLIQIRMDNNYPALIGAMNIAGYSVTTATSQGDTMKILVDLYKQNPSKALGIITSVPYNPSANNYTTSDAFKKAFINYVTKNNPSASLRTFSQAQTNGLDLSGLWNAIYTPPKTISTQTVPTPSTSSSTATIGIVVIALGIIAIAWYMFK